MLLSKEYVGYLAREVTKKLIAGGHIETKSVPAVAEGTVAAAPASTSAPAPALRIAHDLATGDQARVAQGPAAAVELRIGGMTCASCAARVENKLNRMPGVSATVNYATDNAWVALPEGTSVADVIATVLVLQSLEGLSDRDAVETSDAGPACLAGTVSFDFHAAAGSRKTAASSQALKVGAHTPISGENASPTPAAVPLRPLASA